MGTKTTLPGATNDRKERRSQASGVLPPERTGRTAKRKRPVDGQRPRPHTGDPLEGAQPDVVDEASRDSFPASDAPGWTGVAIG